MKSQLSLQNAHSHRQGQSCAHSAQVPCVCWSCKKKSNQDSRNLRAYDSVKICQVTVHRHLASLIEDPPPEEPGRAGREGACSRSCLCPQPLSTRRGFCPLVSRHIYGNIRLSEGHQLRLGQSWPRLGPEWPPSPACHSQRLCSILSKTVWQGAWPFNSATAQSSTGANEGGGRKTISAFRRQAWLTWPRPQAGIGV